MANPKLEDVVKADTAALNKEIEAAAKITSKNASAVADSGESAESATIALVKAYQEVATKNVASLTDAMRSLRGVKTPKEYFELQQKLIKDGVAAAVADSERIGKLTAAVFSVPFALAKKQVEAAKKAAIR